MLKRLTIALLGVVGLVVIGLGIASATVWRADDVLVATTSGDARTLVTDPGVLELGGDPVTVTVEAADDSPVVLAVGRDTDVDGWVGTDAHARVTGLSGWHELAVDAVAAPAPTASAAPDTAATEGAAPAESAAPADGAATPAPEGAVDEAPAVADPTGSDLWVAQATGEGSAELVWHAQPGRWSLLAVSTGDAPPTLSLAWPRTVTTPWLWPCVAVGSLLLVAALALLARDLLRRRRGLDEPEWHAVHTGPIAVGVGADDPTATTLTRRQLREAAAARAAGVARAAGRPADAPDVSAAASAASAADASRASDASAPDPTRPGAGAGTRGAPAATSPSGGAVSPAGRPAAAGPGRDVVPSTAGAEKWSADAPAPTRRALRTGQIPVVGAPGAPSAPGAAAGEHASSSSVPGGRPSGTSGPASSLPGGHRHPVPAGAAGAPPAPGAVRPPAPAGPASVPSGPARHGAHAAAGESGPAVGGSAPGAPGSWMGGGPTGRPGDRATAPASAPDRPGSSQPTAPRPGQGEGTPARAGAPASSWGAGRGQATPPGTPGTTSPARPASAVPASGAPSAAAPSGRAGTDAPVPAGPAVHGSGRPSWATGAPTGGPRPAGWAPVPPAPGQPSRAGSPTSPEAASAHVRPAWLPTPDEQTPPQAPSAGSRGDAWRRAWGLPPTETTDDQEEGR